LRILGVGYRDWALQIYDDLAASTDHKFLIMRSREQYDEQALRAFKPDLVLFYGWSWMVSEKIVSAFTCFMLHPSPLPRYRGGSPIQNQIIAGETNSAVTLFVMDAGIDSGPILAQKPLSLDGGIGDIFSRITRIGIELTMKVLETGPEPVPQDETEATQFPRRTPNDSEITLEEIREKTAKYLYDKIRMLQSPYPNAYIRTSDGKRLLVLDARVEDAD